MPAAAVIPALIAYIKVVAVKKLVVGFRLSILGLQSLRTEVSRVYFAFFRRHPFLLTERRAGFGFFTLKKLECSKQADAIEYISME